MKTDSLRQKNLFPQKQRRICGFSVVEIALALAVVAVSMVAVISLFGFAIERTTDARDDHMASTLVQAVIADRQSTPFSSNSPSISATTFSIPPLDSFPPSYSLYFKKDGGTPVNDVANQQKPGYYYEIDLKCDTAASTADKAKLDFRVSWPANLPFLKHVNYTYNNIYGNSFTVNQWYTNRTIYHYSVVISKH